MQVGQGTINECMVVLNGSADPVMAEYITIMVINNKTPG